MNEAIQKVEAIGSASSLQPIGKTTNRPQAQRTQTQDGLTFSKHLNERLNRRSLELTPDKLGRLSQAVDRVAEKGARESVVLLDNLALLVSVPNRTVLTAIETEKMKNGVFTNIDSVVVG
jgi:flagellar operon protein